MSPSPSSEGNESDIPEEGEPPESEQACDNSPVGTSPPPSYFRSPGI